MITAHSESFENLRGSLIRPDLQKRAVLVGNSHEIPMPILWKKNKKIYEKLSSPENITHQVLHVSVNFFPYMILLLKLANVVVNNEDQD